MLVRTDLGGDAFFTECRGYREAIEVTFSRVLGESGSCGLVFSFRFHEVTRTNQRSRRLTSRQNPDRLSKRSTKLVQNKRQVFSPTTLTPTYTHDRSAP